MAKSMLEMHPEEFAARDCAWQTLKKKFIKRPTLEDVKAVLQAEARIFEVSNNGRHDERLNVFIELDTPEKRAAAKAWFENLQNVYIIAYQNAEKIKHLHKPDTKRQEKLQSGVEACRVAIKILSSN